MKAVMRALVTLGALAVAVSVAPVKEGTRPVKENKLVKLSKSEMRSITAGQQPQAGQPGLTEGKNGPPPYPHHK